MNWLHTIGDLLILAGSLVILTGAIGMLRMPNFFTRLHPASLKDAMGLPLVLAGLLCYSGFSFTSLKLILLFLFMFMTSPTATHAVARTALMIHENNHHEQTKLPSRKKKGKGA